MTAKSAVVFISCIASLSIPIAGLSAPDIRPIVPTETGAWSQAVNGVEGRLLVTQGKKEYRTTIPDIYLELRNINEIVNPVSVYYGKGDGLKLEVVDGHNRKVAPGMGDDLVADEIGPFAVVLPYDSSLRFLVSVAQYQTTESSGALLKFGRGLGGPICLPVGGHGVYFLQGTFTVSAAKAFKTTTVGLGWDGTLTLPKVNLTPLLSNP